MCGMSGYIPTVTQTDELHRKIAPSQAAYDLIHTHCVIVATMAYQLAHHQNMLYLRANPQLTERDIDSYMLHDFAGLPHYDGGLSGNAEGGSQDGVTGDAQTDTRIAGSAAQTADTGDPVTGGTAPQHPLDEHLVLIGGLLHDIGTYRVLKKKHDGRNGSDLKFSGKRYIQHGLLGYEYLLDEGVDESIAQFARNHTGVGLTREHVIEQSLPLPPDDYVPANREQETVMVADKFHSKSVPPKFVSVDAYTARAARFGEDNRRHWLELVDRYGRPDVPALAERWNMRMI